MPADEVRLGPFDFGDTELIVVSPAGDPATRRLAHLLDAIGPPTDRACRQVILEVSRTETSDPSLPLRYRAVLDTVTISAGQVLSDLELNVTRALNRLRLDEQPDLLHLHAGAVSNGRTTVLIIGPSHAGKSTLVAKLVALGWQYLTDEQIAVDGSGRMHAYARPLSLRRESWDFFPEVAELAQAASAGSGIQRIEVAPTDLGTVYRGEPLRPDLIVVPDVSDPEHSISHLSCAETMAILIGDSLDLERADEIGVSALLALVSGAPAVRIAGKDLETRCAAIESLSTVVEPPGEVQATTPAAQPRNPGVPGPASDAQAWLFADDSAAIYGRGNGVLAVVSDDGFRAWEDLHRLSQLGQPWSEWPDEIVTSSFLQELIQVELFSHG